jgi:hypothetical protein
MNPSRVTQLAAAAVLASAVGLTSPPAFAVPGPGYCTWSESEQLSAGGAGDCPPGMWQNVDSNGNPIPPCATGPAPRQPCTGYVNDTNAPGYQPPAPPSAAPPPRRPIQDPVTRVPAPPSVTAPIEAPAPVLRTPVLPGRPNQ